MRAPVGRRCASALLAICLCSTYQDLSGLPYSRSSAIEVPVRSEQEMLERQLYSPAPPTTQSYGQQLSDAIPIKSMRGVWSVREKFDGRPAYFGILTFRGPTTATTEDKGQVVYSGEATEGLGPWIIKSDGFGRDPENKGGIIEMKALWKLRRRPIDGGGGGVAGTYTYSGRIKVNRRAENRDRLPDASIEGDIIELINGGKPKGGSERKVGTFNAVLERQLTTAEDEASGAPEALLMR
jgi:hypothetical protein